MTNPLALTSFLDPTATFQALARTTPSPFKVLFFQAIWLLLLPPTFAWLGAYSFGWRLGADQPLMLAPATLTVISIGYFLALALAFGFVSTAIISRWTASTYGASHSLGLHFALVAVVGSPLAIASVAHLFPHVFFNLVVLIPTMIWSMYLLYKGVPIVLNIPLQRHSRMGPNAGRGHERYLTGTLLGHHDQWHYDRQRCLAKT
ncbi:MAG: Yip1 family protein [Cellvibrionaceae bacterium]